MNSLKDRVIVTTGAASGIGRAMAEEVSRRGAHVVIADRNTELAQEVASQLPDASFQSIDVTDRTSVEAACEQVYAQHGRVDILIANAGVSTMNTFLDLSDEEWNFNLSVNTYGTFLTLQTFARRMVEQEPIQNSELRGKLIATASMAGRAAAPLLAHYSASKFAVIGLVQAVAKELGRHGVTANGVNPGFVATAMQDRELAWEAELRSMTPLAVREEYITQTPLGRIQSPHDVARAIAFLAGPDSDFMTGEFLEVNGGAYMT